MKRSTTREPIDLPEVTLSEHDGVRYLHLDTPWIQGGMRIKKPQVVEIDYVQRMLASLLWLPTVTLGEGRAVQLGLGAGALTRFTAKQLRMATTVVEINPQVIAINAAWFHLPEEAEVVRGDAADWLQQAERSSVRLLHVDLYDHEAAAPVLDDVAHTLGAGSWATTWRVVLPLAAPGLRVGAALVFLGVVTELTATLLLAPLGTSTLATQFWAAAPYAALMVLVSAPATFLLTRDARRASVL